MSDCPNCAELRHALRTVSDLVGHAKEQRDAMALDLRKALEAAAHLERDKRRLSRSLAIVREKNRKLREELDEPT